MPRVKHYDRTVTETTAACEICGFEYRYGSPVDIYRDATTCEARCRALAVEGKRRCYFPPPSGDVPSVPSDSGWRDVTIGSAEDECARHGHIASAKWEMAGERDCDPSRPDGVARVRREQKSWTCSRCGQRDRGFWPAVHETPIAWRPGFGPEVTP